MISKLEYILRTEIENLVKERDLLRDIYLIQIVNEQISTLESVKEFIKLEYKKDNPELSNIKLQIEKYISSLIHMVEDEENPELSLLFYSRVEELKYILDHIIKILR